MKSARVLGLIGFGGASVVVFLVLFLLRLWPHIFNTLQNTVHAVSYACQVAWADITRGQITYAITGVLLLTLFFGWLVYCAYRAIRLSRAVRLPAAPLPVRVLSVAADAGLAASRLTLTADRRAFAMTLGLRRPEVVLSTQAVRVLSVAQLQAVLEHEAHHVRMREPLRRLALTLVLLWVPFRKLRVRLRALYVAASEVEADERVRDQRVLGSALLQLVAPPVAAVGFSPLDARVERLLNPQFRHSGGLALRFAAITLLVVASAIVLAPKSIAAVFGNHPSATTAAHLDMCREEHERMLQSQEQSCGKFSTPQTCTTK
ncbi:MAG: M56 family metallopeptidase [Patescibacteria group bacterium]